MKKNKTHSEIMKKINNANSTDEVENISVYLIAKHFENTAYFHDKKLKASDFRPVLKQYMIYGSFNNSNVYNAFLELFLNNYPDKSKNAIDSLYNKVTTSKKMKNILDEIAYSNLKKSEFEKIENDNNHNQIMNSIRESQSINDLPSIDTNKFRKHLLDLFVTDSLNRDIKTIKDAYINNYPWQVIDEYLIAYCTDKNKHLNIEKYEHIKGSLLSDYELENIKDEINFSNEKKFTFIKEEFEKKYNIGPNNDSDLYIKPILNSKGGIFVEIHRVTRDELGNILEDKTVGGHIYKKNDNNICDAYTSLTDGITSTDIKKAKINSEIEDLKSELEKLKSLKESYNREFDELEDKTINLLENIKSCRQK